MMAGLLIISMLSGAVGSVAALLMAKPIWVALLAYPVTGMLTLVALALWLALRSSTNKTPTGMTAALASSGYARRPN